MLQGRIMFQNGSWPITALRAPFTLAFSKHKTQAQSIWTKKYMIQETAIGASVFFKSLFLTFGATFRGEKSSKSFPWPSAIHQSFFNLAKRALTNTQKESRSWEMIIIFPKNTISFLHKRSPSHPENEMNSTSQWIIHEKPLSRGIHVHLRYWL